MSRAALAALLAGIAFVASGATRLGGAHYWDAATALDYASIGLFSVALVTSGAAYLALARAAGGAPARITAQIGAFGGALAGIANFGEDWLRISELGTWFMIGVVPWGIGGIALGVSLASRRGWRTLAVAPAVTFLAFALVETGGSLVVGLVWIVSAALLRRSSV